MVRLNLQLFKEYKPVTDAIVNAVIRGNYGNGQDRKNALEKANYNYSAVQSAVNAKLKGTSNTTKTTTNTTKTTNTPKTTNNNKATTNTPATSNPTFDGVDQKYVDIAYKEYKPSEKENEYLGKRDEYGQSMEDKINAGPQFSETVTQAFDYLGGALEYFKNGKTSWDDKIYGQISAIENRDKFVYDVDNDQLFQQALASAMGSGKTAMQDTIGQASALTGGYGSTYATSAGNQAYNSFIEDAYANLPQYYQMALSAYQAEGEEMYNLLGMYTQMGEQEWNRNADAYNTVLDFANSQRDFEYGMYQDDITNTYNAMNMYDSFYVAENNKNMTLWQQDIENAWKTIGLQSSDYQFEQTYDQTERWNQKDYDLNKEQFDKTFNANYVSDGKGGYVAKGKAGSGNGSVDADEIPSGVTKKLSNLKNDGEREQYLDNQVANGVITEDEADYLYSVYKDVEQTPLTERTWTMTNDGGINGFLGLGGTKNIDDDGKVKDQYGNEYSMRDLYNELKKTMSDKDAKKYVTDLQLKVGITK